ncbi:MAG: heavy metal translocating P-type ATPase [Planctomycetia bacterium]|nr:heavy metal translocating P-type ATPase [Planctomycetia bacterium]
MTTPQPHCDFCGLPVPGASRARPAAAEHDAPGQEFCCYGCRFASAVTRERGETGAIRWTLARLGLSIFLSMNVMAFTMALWTGDVYGHEQSGTLAAPLFGLFRYLCLLFSFPVVILLGGPLADSAWRALRRGSLSTDLLLLTGTAAAFVLSAVSVFRDRGPIYFEVACVILVMVTLGRWFEAAGRLRAGAALDELQRLLPEFVRVIRGGREAETPAAEVGRGDWLRVLPGERFPTDGRLVEGAASVDRQLVTGESRPVNCAPGDEIFAGTLNLDGALVVEVTSDPGGGTIDRLITAVREARESKGYYQELADRISAWIFPSVATIALAAFGWHWHASGFDQGVTAALAVALVACPCALGLATPLAAWTALGVAARNHVLFRSGLALENLAGVRAVRFDKTGTLTTGSVRVVSCLAAESLDSPAGRLLLSRAAALAAASTHPFSRAIFEFAAARSSAGDLTEIRQQAGRGLVGRTAETGEAVRLGSLAFMEESQCPVPSSLNPAIAAGDVAGHSPVCAGWGGRVQAVFLLEESLRSSALAAVAGCHELGLDVAVLTGDQTGRARKLEAELGVPVLAELLPEQKLAAIRETQARIGPVAMVGDGINDAPALAASDAGVALGCGADVSRDAAQVCLLSDEPDRLVWAIGFARAAVRTMRRNLIWAFAYNTAGVALAASGRLNPALAALLMVVSSVLVVRSSLSLQGAPAGDLRHDRESGAATLRIDQDHQVPVVPA